MTPKDEISIFDFESISDYLTSVFKYRKDKRASFSLRLWAQRLGMKTSDSGNLSRVLSGRRDLSKQMADRISRDLSLTDAERAYFELLSLGREKVSRESLVRIRECLKECNHEAVSVYPDGAARPAGVTGTGANPPDGVDTAATDESF